MAYQSYHVPISVKGIVFENGGVWLRKNQRNEWELPGGKIDEGEQPEETLVRELKEELGFAVEVDGIVDAYLYVVEQSVDEKRGVLVLSYRCKLLKKIGHFEIEGEAIKSRFQKFPLSEVKDLNMPQFYKDAITKSLS